MEAEGQADGLRRRPEVVPLGVADARSGVEVAHHGALVADAGGALKLGGGGLRRLRGEIGEQAETAGVVAVELGAPVVVGPQTGRLEAGLAHLEAHGRAVDHLGVDAVEVHVLKAKVRRSRRGSRCLHAGARDRALDPAGPGPAEAEEVAVDLPEGAVLRFPHVRRAVAHSAGSRASHRLRGIAVMSMWSSAETILRAILGLLSASMLPTRHYSGRNVGSAAAAAPSLAKIVLPAMSPSTLFEERPAGAGALAACTLSQSPPEGERW